MALIKCPECGKEISDKATACPSCGCPLNLTTEAENAAKASSIAPPKKKKGHGCLITVIVFLVLSAIFGTRVAKQQNSGDTSKSTISAAFKDSSMSEDEISAATSALNNCGIESIKSVTHDELLDNAYLDGEKGYRVASGDIDNIILYMNPDNSVHYVKYADNILFENGEIKASIKDFTFTSSEIAQLQTSCQKTVKEILKSPSSAKFPNINEWGFSKQNGEIVIQSYVDSDNSFGANLRSAFQFTIDASDNTVKSFIFDGQELIQ